MGTRGATPGKRLLGLRVIARDGARLTGAAVITRNAMREIEVFLPLSFLGQQTAQGAADGFLVLFSLLWSGIFLLFPLFNRDRLRVGDLLAGTWVVHNIRHKLGAHVDAARAQQPRRTFSNAALDLYGIYELQTLEDVLRDTTKKPNTEEIIKIVRTITRRIRYEDPVKPGQEMLFLNDFYRAQREHLESLKLFGKARENKYHEHAKTEAKKLV